MSGPWSGCPMNPWAAALERHGEITAARAALETSMGVAETEAMLDMLATNGHVRVIAREGTLAYALWE